MKKQRKFLLKLLFFSVTAILLLGSISVSAATQTGFITLNGKSYYINKDGSKQKGWLELNGKKYYFDKNTGVQLKGWARDSDGKAIRYFTNGDGHMVTGFLTDTSGKTRYFDPQTDRSRERNCDRSQLLGQVQNRFPDDHDHLTPDRSWRRI